MSGELGGESKAPSSLLLDFDIDTIIADSQGGRTSGKQSSQTSFTLVKYDSEELRLQQSSR